MKKNVMMLAAAVFMLHGITITPTHAIYNSDNPPPAPPKK
jgi:hypothetical protein